MATRKILGSAALTLTLAGAALGIGGCVLVPAPLPVLRPPVVVAPAPPVVVVPRPYGHGYYHGGGYYRGGYHRGW